MVGCLEQLGLVSDIAANIFSSILQTTNAMNERIVNISTKAKELSAKLPEVEEVLSSKTFRMSSGPTGQRNSDQILKTRLLTTSNMPEELITKLNNPKISLIAPVHEIDRYNTTIIFI